MEQGTAVVYNVEDDNNDRDADVFILYDKTALHTTGSTSNNPISVENYYAQGAIFRKSKRPIDLTGDENCWNSDDDYWNSDQADVQILDSNPRKLLKGESSNSKPRAFNDGIEDYLVVDDDENNNDRTFLCDICVDEKSMSAVFCITGCDHSFCSDCVAKYVGSKLQENISNISCPSTECEGKLEPQHCSSILPRQVFDRWGDALCEALILASEKFYCPFKDCSALLINDSNCGGEGMTLESECPDCHRLFCAQCKVPWHSEVSCEVYQKLDVDERGREDILLKKLVEKKKWMRCPKCRIYVQRSSGCLFMTCRCRCTFCYHCGAQMKDHYCTNCKH